MMWPIECYHVLMVVTDQVTHVTGKPVFWVSDQVQHKQACTITEYG